MLTMDLTGTKLRSNLIEWAEKAGAKFHRSGHEWRSACPLHGGHENSAFAVYTDESGEQKWTCYSGPCGCGDIYDFVQRWQDCDLQTAYQMLGGEQQPDPVKVARAAADHARLAETALQAEIERAQRALDELRHAQSWLAYHQTLTTNQAARDLWTGRGIKSDWQDFWKLGYCPDFVVGAEDGLHHTPSLTIPIHDEEWEVVNVRHRLLTPLKPNDKYRPDRPGLQSAPFIANPTTGFGIDPVIVVEGEIKSMVVYRTLWNGEEQTTPQVIGIPGKTQFRALTEKLAGHDVYICFDPDAGKEALEAARQIKGKIITFPMKIDDAINAGAIDRDGMKRLLSMGRKVA